MPRRRKSFFGALLVIGLWLAFGTVTAHAHMIIVGGQCFTLPGFPPISICSASGHLSIDEAFSEDPMGSGWFTLYDFGTVSTVQTTGLLSSGWTITNSLTDTPAIGTHPFDDPTIANLRFTCTACGLLVGPLDLGTFTATIEGAFGTRVITYDTQAFDTATNVIIGNVGSALFSVIPEPASLALLGVGLAGLGLSRRRKPS